MNDDSLFFKWFRRVAAIVVLMISLYFLFFGRGLTQSAVGKICAAPLD